MPRSLFVIVCVLLGSCNVQGADSPAVLTLKAAGANVFPLKEGGGNGVAFQNFKLNEEGWAALEALPDLKQFTIYGSGKEFGDAELGRLCKIQSLESIFMNGYGGAEDGLAHLAKLTNLRHFGADHSPFTGTGLRALKNCPKFASLRLGGCPFNDAGMEALGELTQLKEANISHVAFTSKGFPHFAQMANLEKLTIAPNYSPYFIGADFVHLSGLKNLHTLIVSEMALPYENGLSHLKGLKLKRLELHDCRVSDGDLEKIKADLPGAVIERLYSIDEKFKGWDREMEKRTKSK